MYQEALNLFKPAKMMDENAAFSKARIYTNLGILLNSLGDYNNAIKSFDTAISFYRAQNCDFESAGTLTNKAMCYENMKDFKKAIETEKYALNLFKKERSTAERIKSVLCISGRLDICHEYKESLQYLTEAHKIATDVGDDDQIFDISECIENAQRNLKKVSKIDELTCKIMTFRTKKEHQKEYLELGTRGGLYLDLNWPEKALQDFLAKKRMGEQEHKSKAELARVSLQIGDAYEKNGNYEAAKSQYIEGLRVFDGGRDEELGWSVKLCAVIRKCNSSSSLNEIITYHEKMFELADQKENFTVQKNACEELIHIYDQRGNGEKIKIEKGRLKRINRKLCEEGSSQMEELWSGEEGQESDDERLNIMEPIDKHFKDQNPAKKNYASIVRVANTSFKAKKGSKEKKRIQELVFDIKFILE